MYYVWRIVFYAGMFAVLNGFAAYVTNVSIVTGLFVLFNGIGITIVGLTEGF